MYKTNLLFNLFKKLSKPGALVDVFGAQCPEDDTIITFTTFSNVNGPKAMLALHLDERIQVAILLKRSNKLWLKIWIGSIPNNLIAAALPQLNIVTETGYVTFDRNEEDSYSYDTFYMVPMSVWHLWIKPLKRLVRSTYLEIAGNLSHEFESLQDSLDSQLLEMLEDQDDSNDVN